MENERNPDEEDEGNEEGEPGRDLAPLMPRGIVPMPEALAEAAAIAEREKAYLQALQSRERILAQALDASVGRTTARQWVDYGGEADPRPTAMAAKTYFQMIGAQMTWLPIGPVTARHPGGQPWVEVETNGHAEVMVTLQVTAIGRVVTADGSRLLDDPFLSSGKRGLDGHARFTDALKAAQANAQVRAFLELGGSAATWERLEAAGIKRDSIPKVVFAESGAAAGKKAVRAMAGQKCPKCGKALVLRDGKRGPFIACTGYPGCKFTAEPAKAGPGPQEAPVEGEGSPLTTEEEVAPGENLSSQETPGEPSPDPSGLRKDDAWEPATIDPPRPEVIEEELIAELLSEIMRVSTGASSARRWLVQKHGDAAWPEGKKSGPAMIAFVKAQRSSAEETLKVLRMMSDKSLVQ